MCTGNLFAEALSFTVVVSLGILNASAQVAYTVSSSSITYNNTTVGMVTGGPTITITNTGTANITISSISLSPSEFWLASGLAPTTFGPGSATHYSVKFAPDAVQTFSGSLSLALTNGSTIVVPLTGSGTATTAKATVSPTSLDFGVVPAGRTSTPQTVTITNTGTSSFYVTSVTTYQPFSVTGFVSRTAVASGKTLQLQVSYFGSAVGLATGFLTISYDVLPAQGVSLKATGSGQTALVPASYPTLPAGTSGMTYSATLTASGGAPPYTWSLASGSTLPSGLTQSSPGLISGTIASGLATGNYTFIENIQDSTSAVASATYTITVSAPTGANCNKISFNIAGSANPLVPLSDLGTGTYLGTQGGLYLNASNARPANNDAAGVSLAKAIVPLDSNGNPDPVNGKNALLSIGTSDAQSAFGPFVTTATADPAKNPHLVIVNGAQGGESAVKMADPNSNYWSTITNFLLPQSGVNSNQVVAAWVNIVNVYPSGIFPGDMTALQSELESIAQNLHTKFPNLRLAYYTPMFYSGYSNGVNDPEPYAYESAFAVRGAILDQINGSAMLNYDPNSGAVMAPWMTWGPYMWANGMLPRSDGLVWTCQDFISDGLHPSYPGGQVKATSILLNFFKTDDTTTPWFLAH